ncbi:hypothetical protein C0J52_23007 [Blattella germanica]|nr:hypothetical protein C0J52_23007 [Blattella germanica]
MQLHSETDEEVGQGHHLILYQGVEPHQVCLVEEQLHLQETTDAKKVLRRNGSCNGSPLSVLYFRSDNTLPASSQCNQPRTSTEERQSYSHNCNIEAMHYHS